MQRAWELRGSALSRRWKVPRNVLQAAHRVRRVRGVAILLALALLLPMARAGDETNPDVTDGADLGIKDRALDLLAMWMTPHPSGLQITFKVASLADPVPGDDWVMSFVLEGKRTVPSVTVGPDGALRTCLCPESYASHGIHSVDDYNDKLTDISYAKGKPGYVSAIIPYDQVPGLGPGVVLQDVRAGTDKWEGRDRWTDVDTAFGADPYVVQRAFLPPMLSKALPYVVGGVILLLAGAAGTWLVLRRRRTAEVVAERGAFHYGPPLAPRAAAPPPDAGGRMNLKPPP